ncbi:cell division protein CrgA [Nocardioides sp.]|uniref:cell division protein CrgA n=1 Tax=Nocardioides sp. TaxID=35761 RepID=UPI00271AEBF0|nr:cell division protein CrgA [Nocardioides sp.]MDO9458235.1 cell division protein CrgA [Nocardioides sp.]
MAKLKAKQQTFNPDRGPVLSVRFGLALLLMAAGIAYIAFYYIGVRAPEGFNDQGEAFPATGPGFMKDLGGWNYLIGFGVFFLGLVISAHPSTPLGRGRGVVVGMLGCFLIGLAWICTFYAISQDTSKVPVFNDLDQKNLVVGIAFMAVGFTFATRWE